MNLTTSRRFRASRPTLEILDSLSLVSVLPTIAAIPSCMDADGGGVERS